MLSKNTTEADFISTLTHHKAHSPDKLLDLLRTKNFVVDSDQEEEEIIQAARDEFKVMPYITLLYIVLGTSCNLDCDYCFVGPDSVLSQESHFSLAFDSAAMEKALSILPDSSKNLTILFYGGEPLLFLDEIKAATQFLKDSLGDAKSLEFVIITNGTLVTEDIAIWLKENNFSIGVSIDGSLKSHDAHRKYRGGKGSYNDALRGYTILSESGCNPSISFTVSDANMDSFWDDLNHIIDHFSPSSMGFNPLITSANGNNYAGVEYAERFSRLAYEGWKYLRDKGIYEDRCMRIIRSITERKVRYNDCGACGNQLVLLPSSRFSICQGLISQNGHTYGLEEWMGRLQSDLASWSSRSPLNMPFCRECIALGVCGGGCPCRLITKGDDFWDIDEQHCIFSRHIVSSFLGDVCKEKERRNTIKAS